MRGRFPTELDVMVACKPIRQLRNSLAGLNSQLVWAPEYGAQV